MTSVIEPPPTTSLDLQPVEQAVLSAEVLPFAATLADPALRARYEELHAALPTGSVPPSLVGLVEAMVELMLQTQRVRRRHGPEAERALTALYYRTPRGAGLKHATREVNEALVVLRGQILEELVFAPTPGGQRLTITTQACRLEIMVDRAGVRVERIELGSVM